MRYRGTSTTVRDTIYVDGAWVPSAGTRSLPVIDPTTEEAFGSIPEGTTEDVAAAVSAARRAFETWSQVPGVQRSAYLTAIADELERRSDEIAELVATEVGMPKAQGLKAQIPLGDFRVAAQLAATYPFEETVEGNLIRREPVGVVGAITPWNYPLGQIGAKVGPALAAGCTVVLKPSEVAPLNAFVLAEIIDEVGLPAGVFNLISGLGPTVGEALVTHPDVDKISFTGSTRAGKRIGELAMQRIARVTLELGGKSPFIIMDDADLQAAVSFGVRNCYQNSGQTCNALTRMLVPSRMLPEVEAIAADVANGLTVGDPLADGTDLGPLVSEAQQKRVLAYIEGAQADGGRVVTGGTDLPEGIDSGFFVRPTIFSDVTNDMTLAREEVFGPVLALIGYDSDDEAVRIANDTDYGLYAGVWSGSSERATTVARRLRAGGVSINGGTMNDHTPFGGYKQSGIGREMGRLGFEEYLETKALIG